MPVASVSTVTGAAPFLKWAGGKSQLLPELRKHIPASFGTYIEPFVGGGALFFDLLPDRAILNDANEELMNAYRVVKSDVDTLIDKLKEYEHSKETFYRVRAQRPTELSDCERAARFIYLNKTCFNGLYRVNRADEFNVPMGSYVSPRICQEERLRAVSHVLKNVTLECTDYKTLLRERAQKHDFIYIDPPYHPVSKFSDFKRYTKEQFREKDQIELRDLIVDLKNRGCFVIANNSSCDFIHDLYKDFEIMPVFAKRTINSRSSGRTAIHEVIIL